MACFAPCLYDNGDASPSGKAISERKHKTILWKVSVVPLLLGEIQQSMICLRSFPMSIKSWTWRKELSCNGTGTRFSYGGKANLFPAWSLLRVINRWWRSLLPILGLHRWHGLYRSVVSESHIEIPNSTVLFKKSPIQFVSFFVFLCPSSAFQEWTTLFPSDDVLSLSCDLQQVFAWLMFFFFAVLGRPK